VEIRTFGGSSPLNPLVIHGEGSLRVVHLEDGGKIGVFFASSAQRCAGSIVARNARWLMREQRAFFVFEHFPAKWMPFHAEKMRCNQKISVRQENETRKT
jgi:hypothetical protein